MTKTPEGKLVWVGPRDMTMFTNFYEKKLLDTLTSGFDPLVLEWRSKFTIAEYIKKVKGLIPQSRDSTVIDVLEDSFPCEKGILRTDYS